MRSNGHWPDLIDLWLDYTSGVQSPDQFRLWTGLSLVGAALERRVWAKAGEFTTFPNLYVMLVAAPGIGKYVIEKGKKLFAGTTAPNESKPVFHVTSDSVTRAALMDELVMSKAIYVPAEGPPFVHHSLMIFAEEFQVLMPIYDHDMVARLTAIYNGSAWHRERRRTGSVRELAVEAPLFNMLAGAQPAYLASTFPEDAWSSGIGRRIMMIYAADSPILPLFQQQEDDEEMWQVLLRHFSLLSQLHGQFHWEQAAADLAAEFNWHWRQRQVGQQAQGRKEWIVPNHTRLVHYNQSRTMFLIKLAMIAAAAARGELVIRLPDVERSLHWLLEAEKKMPDIFREMRGKSDRDVMEELHHFAMATWARDRQKPLHTSLLINFLSDRVPSEKVERILLLAERANLVARVAGTAELWTPRPMYERKGVE